MKATAEGANGALEKLPRLADLAAAEETARLELGEVVHRG